MSGLVQWIHFSPLHCKKKVSGFPVAAGMSLTKLSAAENNLIIPGHGESGTVSDIPAGDGKTANLFSQCTLLFQSIMIQSEEAQFSPSSHAHVQSYKSNPVLQSSIV